MTQAAQSTTREPTMEEILASIRRIIEDGNEAAAEIAASAPETAAAPAEIAEFQQEFGKEAIAESLQHAGAMTALGQKIGAKNTGPLIEAEFHRTAKPEPAEASAPEPMAKAPAPITTISHREEKMAAVEHIELHAEDRLEPVAVPEPMAETPFERHLRPILSDMAGRQVSAAFSDLTSAIEKERQQSLAEIAEDMIRPMLQEWLDNNLPTMVERLVREEIERVSRSGRR
jgi:cell pole-organizing protein PopZ